MLHLSLLVIGIFLPSVQSQYFFVTAPNIIRFDHDETVLVSVFGLQNARITVWLQHGNNRFSQKDVDVPDQKNPAYTTLRVTEKDLFSTVVEEKPRYITIGAEYNGFTQTRVVILSYQTGYLIVQTDKPIYTPLQRVKVRTLALDESLTAVKGWQVGMDIVSPSNLTMARRVIDSSSSGFYTNDFTLPPNPELGVWTARAFYKGQLETQSSSAFVVDEYVLPTFGVTIEVNKPVILEDTPEIEVTVRAKYVYRKPVDGNVRLTFNLKDEDGVSEYLMDMQRDVLTDNNDGKGSVKSFKVKVSDLLRSPLLENAAFPDGKRLEIIATVFEHATGKEEAASHSNTVFAFQPFKFKFTRSKLNFRPGWEYYVKVSMVSANGEPATDQSIRIKLQSDRRPDEEEETITDSNGNAVAIFHTLKTEHVLTFKAITKDLRVESDSFVITAYEGDNQIQVERTTDSDVMTMRAFTDVHGDEFTGMLFVVVNRGKVVFSSYKDQSNQQSEEISEHLQELISPSARLLVFYVDKTTNDIVADSIKFDVTPVCRGKGLTLEAPKDTVKPGGRDELTVKGSQSMWVGLNVMDKALLLLNNKNVLTKNKMFDALRSHDLGCGEGSGKNSGDVFKKTGLTVLTNAKISNDVARPLEECEKRHRKKRSFDDFAGLVNGVCIEDGIRLAQKLYDTDDRERINVYTQCYSSVLPLAKSLTRTTKCIVVTLKVCVAELTSLVSNSTVIFSKSLTDESAYAEDLARIADAGIKPYVRTDFRESWLFDVVQLSEDGEMTNIIDYPDSITEWMIQAIGITENKGMCVAEPLNITGFRDFFIQLDLPYKAARFEIFDVKATIFNYGLPGDPPKTANVYFESVPNLCYESEPGNPSEKRQLELPPNSAETVRFPVVPLKNGQFPITVSAFVVDRGIPDTDVIRKRLQVVNEGIEEKISIQVCLDPGSQQEDCKHDDRVISDVQVYGNTAERIMEIDLALPPKSITGTGSATAYMQSHIMDNVVKTLIEGVDSLFRQPAGCGEQTMIRLAPTVYAMMYLKETKQTTADIEIKGNQYIRDGVNREVSMYRHPDGSYAAWQNRASSTWLTAFVAKVFCQAKDVVDDAVDVKEDIALTIDWLKNAVNNDGSYNDAMPVIHREMIGQINENDPSLTSFVLVTLQECKTRTEGIDEATNKAMGYVEKLFENQQLLRNNPYLLALSTYALAKSKSTKKWDFKNLLWEIRNEHGKDVWWGNAGGHPASAQAVETTSYALLAMLEYNDFRSSARIVRWLTSQRDAQGSFRTTQDTVVGLQALSTYSVKTYTRDVNLKVSLLATDWPTQELTVTHENAIVQQIAKNLPVEHANNQLTVKVSGTGAGRMMIDLRYNRPLQKDEMCPFDVSPIEKEIIEDLPFDVNIGNARNCDVCGKCDEPDQPLYDEDELGLVDADPKIESNFGRRKRAGNRDARATKKKTCIRFTVSSKNDKKMGMSIVNFGLQTGVEVVKEDLDLLVQNDPNIAHYETSFNNQGFIVFYLSKVTLESTKFTFRLVDNFEGDANTRQATSVKTYDYYHPDQSCTTFYGIGPNDGKPVKFECDDDNYQCKCLQNQCVVPVEDEIKRIRTPAIELRKYTCNPEKANYAAFVEITELSYDPDKEEKLARATVITNIHEGIQPLRRGDEMLFYWSMRCDFPDLEEGKKYYVIGKDGFKIDPTKDDFKYPLMGTTLVIRNVEPRVKRTMSTYKRLMQLRSCAL